MEFFNQIFKYLTTVRHVWGVTEIMGYDATVLQVTLEMMPSECLNTCPRTVDRRSRSEDRC